jgi:hypothetical protein
MVVTFLLGFVAALATRFWAEGGLDPDSDGAALRRAAGAFCRNFAASRAELSQDRRRARTIHAGAIPQRRRFCNDIRCRHGVLGCRALYVIFAGNRIEKRLFLDAHTERQKPIQLRASGRKSIIGQCVIGWVIDNC